MGWLFGLQVAEFVLPVVEQGDRPDTCVMALIQAFQVVFHEVGTFTGDEQRSGPGIVGDDDVVGTADNGHLVAAGEVAQASELTTMVGVCFAFLERPDGTEPAVAVQSERPEVGNCGEAGCGDAGVLDLGDRCVAGVCPEDLRQEVVGVEPSQETLAWMRV